MQTVWGGPSGNQARFKAFSFKWPSLSSHQGGNAEELGHWTQGKVQQANLSWNPGGWHVTILFPRGEFLLSLTETWTRWALNKLRGWNTLNPAQLAFKYWGKWERKIRCKALDNQTPIFHWDGSQEVKGEQQPTLKSCWTQTCVWQRDFESLVSCEALKPQLSVT